MNYDDKFTREFEEKFQESLKKIRNFKPADRQKLETNLIEICNFVEELSHKPIKSPEEIELFQNLQLKIPKILQSLEDMKLVLNESLYRQSRAYFENVKKLAKEGNKEAEKIYLDLKSHFEDFDVN